MGEQSIVKYYTSQLRVPSPPPYVRAATNTRVDHVDHRSMPHADHDRSCRNIDTHWPTPPIRIILRWS